MLCCNIPCGIRCSLLLVLLLPPQLDGAACLAQVVDSNTVVGILDITKLLFDVIGALEKAPRKAKPSGLLGCTVSTARSVRGAAACPLCCAAWQTAL